MLSIAAFKAVNPGLIPGWRSFVLQVLNTESYDECERLKCGGTVVSIAAFKAGTQGSIPGPGRCSFVLQVLKTESYHESRSCY